MPRVRSAGQPGSRGGSSQVSRATEAGSVSGSAGQQERVWSAGKLNRSRSGQVSRAAGAGPVSRSAGAGRPDQVSWAAEAGPVSRSAGQTWAGPVSRSARQQVSQAAGAGPVSRAAGSRQPSSRGRSRQPGSRGQSGQPGSRGESGQQVTLSWSPVSQDGRNRSSTLRTGCQPSSPAGSRQRRPQSRAGQLGPARGSLG